MAVPSFAGLPGFLGVGMMDINFRYRHIIIFRDRHKTQEVDVVDQVGGRLVTFCDARHATTPNPFGSAAAKSLA